MSIVDQRLTVTRRGEPAVGVVHLVLEQTNGEELPSWEPGAHVDVVLAQGLVRQYSLCGDPADGGRWEVAVLREPAGRGGSAYLHDHLAVGDEVRVRGPRNHFQLEPAAAYVFIAGGIGITPLVPMLARATTAGASWQLTYGGRSRSSMAFADRLCAEYGSRVEIVPEDSRGLLDLDRLLSEPRPDTLVYTCGPGPLLDAVGSRMVAWPAGSLHLERFSTTADPQPVPAVGTAFEVELTRSGMTLTVQPAESILEAVERAGVNVLSSCREGTCGTCETAVVAGTPDHRDQLLSDAERATNDCMMICVSRAQSARLLLEL